MVEEVGDFQQDIIHCFVIPMSFAKFLQPFIFIFHYMMH